MSTKITSVDVVGQQIQMLNLLLDLEQNQEDALFSARDGNRIHYVFDENVFEMFIRPRRMKGYTSTFDSPFWRKLSRETRGWSSYAAQSALVASEYLFSGDLPGQNAGKIYMTEWHQSELMRRVAQILSEQQDAVDATELSTEASGLEKSLANIMAAGRRRLASPDAGHHTFAGDPQLEGDITALAARGGDDEEGLTRFKVARIAAQTLASDTVFEPIEQVSRVLSNDIWGRLSNLTSRLAPTNRDLDDMSKLAKFWHRKLKEEIALTPLRPGEKPRPEGAMWSDANSLALVSYASDACDRERERVVLVTGDAILFNAYRRWFVDTHEEKPGTAGHFMLRRLVQYAPILNMNKRLSDFSHSVGLIESTQQAMEVSLLPFNLSGMSSVAADPEKLYRGRGHFALKKVTEESVGTDPSLYRFLNLLPPEWFSDQQERLRELCELWKQTERMAIGSMFKLISRRLNNRQKMFAEALAARGEQAIGHLLTARANKSIKKILDGNGGLFIPAASNFIDEQLRSSIGSQGRLPLRAPIAVRITLRSGKEEHDLVDLVERWARGDDPGANRLLGLSGRSTEAESELAFAVASVLALGLHQWSEADRYAGLAVRAAILGARRRGETSDDQSFEMRYMHAVAKRFRVGEIGKPAIERTAAVLKNRYDTAKSLLDSCFVHHQRNFERPANHDHAHVLRLFRTRSERAALHLFFGASIGMADFSNWEHGGDVRALGAGAMQDAAADLAACNRLLPTAIASARGEERREKFLGRLRRQFISNLAAHHVLTDLFYGTQVRNTLPTAPEILMLVERHDLLKTDLPFVVQAEIAALFAMGGRDPVATQDELETLRREKLPKSWLAFDRDIFDRIFGHYGRRD